MTTKKKEPTPEPAFVHNPDGTVTPPPELAARFVAMVRKKQAIAMALEVAQRVAADEFDKLGEQALWTEALAGFAPGNALPYPAYGFDPHRGVFHRIDKGARP